MALTQLLAKCEQLLGLEKEELERNALKTQPSGIQNAQLYPYQMEGLNWLISLYKTGTSGILGDDMGLGTLPIQLCCVG